MDIERKIIARSLKNIIDQINAETGDSLYGFRLDKTISQLT